MCYPMSADRCSVTGRRSARLRSPAPGSARARVSFVSPGWGHTCVGRPVCHVRPAGVCDCGSVGCVAQYTPGRYSGDEKFTHMER